MANIFSSASIWFKIASVSVLLGLVLFVIGFATPSWRVYPGSQETRGLWQFHACGIVQCGTYSYSNVNVPDTIVKQTHSQESGQDFHRAIQAMESIGLIGYVLSTLCVILYICSDSFRRRDYLQAATAITFAGIVFASIGFALFGSTSNRNNLGYGSEMGWSMGISLAGTVLYGVAGVMLIVQLIR